MSIYVFSLSLRFSFCESENEKRKSNSQKIIILNAACVARNQKKQQQPQQQEIRCNEILHKDEVKFRRMIIIIIGFRVEMG